MNILLVEDEPISRLVLFHIVKKMFFDATIDEAEDGQIGFDLFSTKKYDIVFTDIMMPNMNGIELIDKIRSINETPLIVVVSAFEAFRLDLIDYSNLWFVEKPIDVLKLRCIPNEIKMKGLLN